MLAAAVLLVLVLAGGAAWWMLFRNDAPSTLYGQIVAVDSASAPSGASEAGAFRVRWDAEEQRLSVAHAREPGRTLWASRPGEAFLMAARGEGMLEGKRSHFHVEADRRATCTRQRVDRIEAAGDTVRLTGTLACTGGAPQQAGWSLAFFPEKEEGHLGFSARVDDPRLNRLFLTYASDPEERFAGFGMQFSYAEFKGRRVPIFAGEQGVGRGRQPLTFGADLTNGAGGAWHSTYAPVPFYLTNQNRALFLENYAFSAFDLRDPERVQIELWHDRMKGRILHGRSPMELVERYTAFAGRMRALPHWITSGAVVGVQGGTEKVRRVWKKLRAEAGGHARGAGVPVAALWLQDWVGQRETSFGQQLWWNWTLDRRHYRGFERLRADLDSAGVRLMTYVNPFLADVSEKEPPAARNLFAEAKKKGLLVKDSTSGGPRMVPITSFSAGLLDLSNPKARAWMRRVMRREVLSHTSGGWMADFGEGLPLDARLHGGTSPRRFHNRYPEVWARLNRRVIENTSQPDSLVFFMRAGYTRSPRYATLFWLGDQLTSWDRHDGIKTAVTGMLSGGLSGFSLTHSDVGGYTAIGNPLLNIHRSRELLMRWAELAAFTPVFRTHEGNRPALNHQIYDDDSTLVHVARMAKIYRALRPYRRRLIDEAAATGRPVVRHPLLHFPGDPRVWQIHRRQFMLGPDFMIAPVLEEGARSVAAYLPAGRWTHLWTGETFATDGDTVQVDAPLGEPGVFFRAGSAAGRDLRNRLRRRGLLR